MLTSIFSTSTETAMNSLSLAEFLMAAGISMISGLGVAMIYMYKNHYRKDFVVTLAILPLIVQLVIMLVNGNLGAGVAVMGAFSLVRFRSIPGTAKDIASIFCAMALGLATGMGYLTVALLFLVCIGLFHLILHVTPFGEEKGMAKQLRITIPEELNYIDIFDELMVKYTKDYQLTQVKTTNMGSLYELTYSIRMKTNVSEEAFIDELRCRNGNLRIILSTASFYQEAI